LEQIVANDSKGRFSFSKDTELLKMNRYHVHLSADLETAKQVASRRYKPIIILKIQAKQLHDSGRKFYRSEKGVWLNDLTLP